MNNMDKGWPLHEVKPSDEEKKTNEEEVATTAVMEGAFPLGKEHREEPTVEKLLEIHSDKLGVDPKEGLDYVMNEDTFIYLSLVDEVPVIVIEDLKTGKILENRIENDSDIHEMKAVEGVPVTMVDKANENKPEAIAA